MAVKVTVPTRGFNGVRAGAKFKDSVAVFEDAKLGKEIAERFGYEVETVKAPAKPSTKKAQPAKKETADKGEA